MMRNIIKSNILLFDSAPIIDLCRIGVLDLLFESAIVHISERLFSECVFYTDMESGNQIYIDYKKYIEREFLILESVPLDMVSDEFGVNLCKYLTNVAEMHEGEIESAVLLNNRTDLLLCSGEEEGYKFMGFLGLGNRTVSLEKLFGGIGNLPMKYSEIIRRAKVSEGISTFNEVEIKINNRLYE